MKIIVHFFTLRIYTLPFLHGFDFFGIGDAVELIDEGVDLCFEGGDISLDCFAFARNDVIGSFRLAQGFFSGDDLVGKGGESLQ